MGTIDHTDSIERGFLAPKEGYLMRQIIYFSLIVNVALLGLYQRITSREEAMEIVSFDILPLIETQLLANGFNRATDAEANMVYNHSTIKPHNYSTLKHEKCHGLIVVKPAHIMADNSIFIEKLARNNDRVSFMLYDRKWNGQDRLEQSFSWFLENALHSFGAGEWLPTKQGLLFFADRDCELIHEGDWSSIWLKNQKNKKSAAALVKI